jgi:oligoribonuclease NrnB/cAMP/cGMP phosphodiesterase (DHH superfamily)
MISIYCAEQLDGIAAAAIVTRYARLKKLTTRFGGFLHHEKLTQQITEMSKNSHIFVLGMCPKREHIPAIKKTNVMYWSTHDATTPKIPARIFDQTVERKCSAELAQQRFLPNDVTARKLAALAHNMTYWKKSADSQQLTDIIASGYNPTELINSLSKGVTWSPQLEKARDEYLQKKEDAFNSLLKTLKIRKYISYNVCFALSSNTLTGADAAQKILDVHDGVDVAIVIFKNGKLSFRRRDECILNLRKIAQLFDGGGPVYASGGYIDKKVTKENYEQVMQIIDSRIKNYIYSNK